MNIQLRDAVSTVITDKQHQAVAFTDFDAVPDNSAGTFWPSGIEALRLRGNWYRPPEQLLVRQTTPPPGSRIFISHSGPANDARLLRSLMEAIEPFVATTAPVDSNRSAPDLRPDLVRGSISRWYTLDGAVVADRAEGRSHTPGVYFYPSSTSSDDHDARVTDPFTLGAALLAAQTAVAALHPTSEEPQLLDNHSTQNEGQR